MARDMTSGKTRVIKVQPVPTYDASRYETRRLFAPARDGTRIPISVAMPKGTRPGARAPLFLYAYGSYGAPNDAFFNAAAVSYLDRGVIVATAHIRGGGEYGKPWHDAGRMMNKRNTFTDFIDAAEYLVKEGWTTSDRLAINGVSAGGLLMGAVLNLRPDLFKAALVEAPFVDVVNTMLDESLPLTVEEFEEWGNPKERGAYDYMMTYSPYDNVKAQAYPAILVRSAYNDSQVFYHEPAKWVAKLRALKTDKNPLLLRMEMDPAGHGGRSGRYNRLHDAAYYLAFVLWQLGLTR
jgi:oligopeptidase B